MVCHSPAHGARVAPAAAEKLGAIFWENQTPTPSLTSHACPHQPSLPSPGSLCSPAPPRPPAVCRVWDMRTKVQIHCLAGHTDNVAAILAQPADPQVGVVVFPLFSLFSVGGALQGAAHVHACPLPMS